MQFCDSLTKTQDEGFDSEEITTSSPKLPPKVVSEGERYEIRSVHQSLVI
jgi:hypothetical protein